MNNCFTMAYRFLNEKGYKLPDKFEEWTNKDMDTFVINEREFLKNQTHIAFFDSFCSRVNFARRYDVVLTRSGVGIALNSFKQWIWSEETKSMKVKAIRPDSIIMRIKNG